MANQEGRSGHLIWWLLALAAAGLLAYYWKSQDVFPSASIDLKVSRANVLALTDTWAKQCGYDPQGSIKSTIFSYDDEAKTFLEHELGLGTANSLMKDTIPVWYWSARLCRPLRLEEFDCYVSPAGKVISFERKMENDAAAPSLAHSGALSLAKAFVEQKMGLSLQAYKTVQDGSISQTHRTDHYFTWEDAGQNYAGARLRTYVYVSGNQVTAFNHYLYIPETWLRKFSEMRSYNKALEEVASIFYSAFNLATFFAFMYLFAKGKVRWRLALSVAAFVGVIDYLEALNAIPNTMHGYTTTVSYNGFVLDIYVSALWSSLAQALQTMLLVGAAEAIYRLAYPDKIFLEKLFTRTGLRTRQVISGLVAGHAAFGVHMGWVILYYLSGKPLHFWSPLEVQNLESLSTVVPAFSAVNVGVSAAVSEELTYRVLGMSIFSKLVRNFWLSNLMQAAAWAFMHSTYPQEPAYARGIELTVVGFFYGFILRRYGLIATIVSHYVFDAFLSITPLTASGIPLLKLSSFLAVAPFALALVIGAIAIKRHGFAPEAALTNASVPVSSACQVVSEIFPEKPYSYEHLSPAIRKFLLAVIVVAASISFTFELPIIGQKSQLAISRDEAIAKARQYLVERKVPANARMATAWLSGGMQDTLEWQYVFEQVKYRRAKALAEQVAHPLQWHVRFFKPLDPEEYLVSLDATGKPLSMDITCAEDAPGDRLEESAARGLALRYLGSEHADLTPLVFDSVRKEERKQRVDYRFTFKVPKLNVPGAEFKVNVRVIGSQVSGFETYWDLPDKWVFEQSRHTTKDQVSGYLVASVALILLVAIIWWIVGVVRSGAVHWRAPVYIGLIMSLLVIPQTLNDLPEFYVGYSTDTPLSSYFVAQCVKQILTAVQMIASVTGLAAFSLGAFKLLFPRLATASIIRAGLFASPADGGRSKREIWLDAILTGYAAGFFARALAIAYVALHAQFSPVVTLSPLESFCGFANVSSPSADSIMDSLTRGLQTVLVAGIAAGIYAKYCRSPRTYLLLALFVSLVYPATDRYWQDYALDAGNYFGYFLFSWLFIRKLARQNVLSYFLSGFTSMLAGSLRVLSAHGRGPYLQDIVLLIIVLASPALYLLYLYYRKDGDEAKTPLAEPAKLTEIV